MDWTPIATIALLVGVGVLAAAHQHKQFLRRRMLHGLQGEPLRVEVFRLHSKGTGTLHTVSGKVAGVRQGALLLTGLAVDPIAPYAQEWARQGIPLGEIVALHTPDGRKVEWARLNAITADIANHN